MNADGRADGWLGVVIGLPGSGKTTRARSLAAAHHAVRLCPDEWMMDLGVDLFDEGFRARLEQRLLLLARHVLDVRAGVVVEFGSWSRGERDALLQLARSSGARAEIHVLDPPIEVLRERLEVRNGEAGQIVIDSQTLQSCLPLWQPPSADELAQWDNSFITQ